MQDLNSNCVPQIELLSRKITRKGNINRIQQGSLGIEKEQFYGAELKMISTMHTVRHQ